MILIIVLAMRVGVWAFVAASATAFHQQPAPPTWVPGVAFVAAWAAVGPRRLWRLSRYAITAAHEGGHALVAMASGRRLKGIRLHSDASGLTLTSGREGGPGMVATCLAGYLAPSMLGLAVAWLLAERRVVAVLLLTIVLLIGMLVAVRNLFGVLTIGASSAAVLAVASWVSPTGQSLFAWTTAWFLLLGAVRPVWELRRTRRAHRVPTSDADQLAALTHVPALVWVALFASVTVAALVVGGRWLILTAR